MLRAWQNTVGTHVVAFLTALIVCLPLRAEAIDLGPLKGVIWGQGRENIVVILHGDGGPGRYDNYASALAKQHPNTTVVTLTRPAYRYRGEKSPGNNRSKDHYTKRNNKLVAQSLAAMRKSLPGARLIAIGHSGGSGQLGTVIGAYPGIVDVAILAACPCNVPKWRLHRRGKNNWRQSQSPHKFAGKIPTSTRVYAVTTKNDGNTLVRFAKEYAAIAQAAGVKISLVVPPKGGHGWQDYQAPVDKIIRSHLR